SATSAAEFWRRVGDEAASRDRFRVPRFSLHTRAWNTRSIFLLLLALFIAARRSLIVALFIVVITPSLLAQIKNGEPSSAATRPGDTFDKSAQVDALITAWARDDTPGAAVLVIQDGKVLHRKGYGLASLTPKTPITAETGFCLCSITKQFTAMAVLILVERGKLHYDDTLAQLLPEFPAYAKKITLRHLLQHTAGLPDFEKILYDNGMVKWEPGGFEPTLKDIVALL